MHDGISMAVENLYSGGKIMRGLFKMEGAKVWSGILIVAGVILIIAALIVDSSDFGRAYVAIWGNPLALFLIGLGIVFIVIARTVNKLCTSISQMMQAYDEELHKKLSEIKSNSISNDSTSKIS